MRVEPAGAFIANVFLVGGKFDWSNLLKARFSEAEVAKFIEWEKKSPQNNESFEILA